MHLDRTLCSKQKDIGIFQCVRFNGLEQIESQMEATIHYRMSFGRTRD